MKILLHPKDHPWKTQSGYGIAGMYMTHYLIDKHEVAVLASVGNMFSLDYVDDTKSNGDPVRISVYPGAGDQYGEDIVGYHYDDFKAEILLQMADAWILNPDKIPKLARSGKIHWILIPPIDFLDPIPKRVIETLSAAFKVVPWCRDAYDRLLAHGLTNVMEPIPLGINTGLWQPLDRYKFPKTMEAMGFTYDSFNILMVNANQFFRKAWAESLEGVAIFKHRNPDAKIRLYLHTPSNSPDGWNMVELAETSGLADITRGLDTYHFVTGRYDEEELVKMFNMADVCVNCGLEGFGYASLQAQAVGVPVIGLNAGPTPEIVKYGVLVKPAAIIRTPSLQTNAFPSPLDIADALQMLYDNPGGKFAKQRDETIEWVKQTFSWEVIMKKWFEHLDRIEEELDRACVLRSRYPPKPSNRSLELAQQVKVLE